MSSPGVSPAVRIGVLYPGEASAADEYETFVKRASFPIELHTVFTEAADTHEVSDLFETGEFDRLVDGGRRLMDFAPDVVLWACTSGSFVYGAQGARDQARAIADATGLPATSTSLAFAAALQTLEFCKVAVLGPYPPDLLAYFETFLAGHDIEIASITAMGSAGGTASSALGLAEFEAALGRLTLDGVDCVLLPDTAAFGFAVAEPLSEIAQRPVLAANPVSLWHATRLAGVEAYEPSFGVLAGAALPA